MTAAALASAPAADTCFWAGRKASPAEIAAWVEAFHRDGYVFIPDVLPPELCDTLRGDLERQLVGDDSNTACRTRMFETSRANLDLFDLEPIVTLAEAILGEDRIYGTNTAHVVHNNSFRTKNGGGWSGWHQDDSAHFVCTDGKPPTNIHLPCLLMTCNYYLTDQETAQHCCGQVIPGSHKWGLQLPSELKGTQWEDQIVSCGGKKGSAMVFNCQVYHRGAPNLSDRTRYVTQVTYGRKMVGHFYHPFMNYQMPAHCYEGADDRRKRLLGFKPHGPYG
jgi:ectoine hydroxylase-related dioxygenase (phytanoyl-CoA dioxygenase family)